MTTVTASAGGQLAASTVKTLGSQVAAQLGGKVTNEDVAPTTSEDRKGTSLFYFLIICTIGGYLSNAVLAQALPRARTRTMLLTAASASDLPQRLVLRAEDRDLFPLRERQAAAREVPAPPRPDPARVHQDPFPGPPARAQRLDPTGDEITRLHPRPEHLQQIRPEKNRVGHHSTPSVRCCNHRKNPSIGYRASDLLYRGRTISKVLPSVKPSARVRPVGMKP
ncbi:hypothetical protein [Curtobacterium sp. VKM Ac-1376]|uniref:hypothetical protein n=1 Tax=Curtobacterium sp. VKM Ac-1376 TaxID=123312 RepID=UPI00188B9B79|nr:hypothetical protein [Curtobacterium sp. VKM Ac-1376]MBF4616370.1 hypothetical protein [Curtobacterium sp. VKM Ac-1376]